MAPRRAFGRWALTCLLMTWQSLSAEAQPETKRGTVPQDALALRTLYRNLGRPSSIQEAWMTSDPCLHASSAVGLACALLEEPVVTPGGGEAWYYVQKISLNSGQSTNYDFGIEGTLPGAAFTDGQLSRLQYLDISYSSLSGSIPDEISNLASLGHLALAYNKMNGSVPSALAFLNKLSVLVLEGNKLTGSLPPGLTSLAPSLRTLDVGRNLLQGELPALLSSLSELIYLDLGYNQFNLGLPAQLTSLANLTGLYLENNLLSGTIPPEYGNFKKLAALKLSNNQLSGDIPLTLTQVTTLQQLILNNNQLTGKVPDQLASMPNLKVLSLQNNMFSGSVGPAFHKFPQGFLFNPSLCINLTGSGKQPCTCADGAIGYQKCNATTGPGPCICPKAPSSIAASPEGGLSTTWIVLITVGAGLLAGLLAVLGLWGYRTNFGRRKPGGWEYAGKTRSFPDVRAYRSQAYDPDEIDSYGVSPYDPPSAAGSDSTHGRGGEFGAQVTLAGSAPGLAAGAAGSGAQGGHSTAAAFARKFGRALNNQLTMRQFSYDELELATNNFSMDNIVATDGNRKMYSGILPSGTYICVKELESIPGQSAESFAAAVEMFSLVRCPQLVEVLGSCLGPRGARLLVQEQLANGTLELHLHDLEPNSPALEWSVRMSVTLQVAQALAYLHARSPQMVHQRIQASAVLLDEQLNAKVTDYCLDSLKPSNGTGAGIANSQSPSTSNMAVAAGIVAPELAWSAQPTARTDVYAFGVLALEIITGRRPIDSHRPPSEQSLVRWVKPRLSDRALVEGLVDHRIRGGFSSAALYQVALLASQCIQVDPESRPSMAQAVEVLTNVQNLAIDNKKATRP